MNSKTSKISAVAFVFFITTNIVNAASCSVLWPDMDILSDIKTGPDMISGHRQNVVAKINKGFCENSEKVNGNIFIEVLDLDLVGRFDKSTSTRIADNSGSVRVSVNIRNEDGSSKIYIPETIIKSQNSEPLPDMATDTTTIAQWMTQFNKEE